MPTTRTSLKPRTELPVECGETLIVFWTRTLNQFKFFSRKQENAGSLQQFWSSWNGLVGKSDFAAQIESLRHGIFPLNVFI